MHPRPTFALAAALLFATASAQDQRRLEVELVGAPKDTVYLANYYGSKLYYADTAFSDARGKVVFAREQGYLAGVYAVVTDGPKYFEVLLDEPLVQLRTNITDLTGAMEVKNSRQNERFFAYIKFLAAQKAKGEGFRAQLADSTSTLTLPARAVIKGQLEELDRQVKEHQQSIVKDMPGTLLATIVKMSMPQEPQRVDEADGTMDTTATYYANRAHFWDNVTLSDPRIVRTPVFQNKFEEYIGKMVPQVPDTINRLADELIARLGQDEEPFKFVVHNITYKYETSDLMGMDKVFVHMAQTYYCPAPGKASRANWMSDEKLGKMCERADKMAPLTLGSKSAEIILTDSTEQRWVSMHQMPQDYVVVLFWDPHCGHCKKEVPDMHKTYLEKLKPMGIGVYAVANARDSALFTDWKEFIHEKRFEWVDVALTHNVYKQAVKDASVFVPRHTTVKSLNYSDTYDVFSTPKVFLVDRERKFVGKQLSADQIADLVARLRERDLKKLRADDQGK
jgi:thiol-disulfide isomerase/thioredoxin